MRAITEVASEAMASARTSPQELTRMRMAIRGRSKALARATRPAQTRARSAAALEGARVRRAKARRGAFVVCFG